MSLELQGNVLPRVVRRLEFVIVDLLFERTF